MAPLTSLAETAHHLRAALQIHDSATLVLQDYCHRFAAGQPIQAIALPATEARPRPDLRTKLQVSPSEKLVVRHVSLRCGTIELSDAWNWYVPARLSRSMNSQLETTTMPFGHVVSALAFRRQTVSSQSDPVPGKILLRNTALLVRGEDQLPFSFVEENYLTEGFTQLTRMSR